ncbi:hypothetical protein C6V83_04360 [Gordonia iterans]|uniref:Uncharacterized protein n=1 Tax=Gordonia iterans TaxID=1004901 RepID=A0A2S0KD71_9ACTN|nr:hypothetical protein [Gordonia iterans]AVL99628.1 hypothetical protein C6V83_04360 [Gordonia iterans]
MNAVTDPGTPVDDGSADRPSPESGATGVDPAYRAADITSSVLLWLLQCAAGVAGLFIVGLLAFAGADCGLAVTGGAAACTPQSWISAPVNVALFGGFALAIGFAGWIGFRIARGGLGSRVAGLGLLIQAALAALCVLAALVMG